MKGPEKEGCVTRVTINGQAAEFGHTPEASALEVIREQAGLTGAKLVCGAGVCGACTVLVDGQPTTTCMMPATAMAGKEITTIEHYGPDNLHPVQKAFLAHDGLQCGFCTPGFVNEAIAYYQRWRAEHGRGHSPSRAEIGLAMSGHLCRCGAYAGIFEAVRSACAGEFDEIEEFTYPRHEGMEKVTGQAKYTVDVYYDGMLAAKVLGSPHAHAAVRSIDTSRAEAIPGVRGIIDVLDDPHRVVRYVGHPVLAVAAIDEATAAAALAAVEIDYELRLSVVDPKAARAAGEAIVFPEKNKKTPNASEGPIPPGKWEGNVRTPLANKALSTKKAKARQALNDACAGGDGLTRVEHTFSTPAQTHTALEPHACVANWANGKLTVHTSTQTAFVLANEIAKHYKLDRNDVTVLAKFIGGAFGSKQGMRLEHTVAIELSRKTGAPVKLALDRHEEMVLGGFRPSTEIEMAIVADRQSNQRGMTARAWGCCGIAVQSQVAPWVRFTYGGPKDCEDFDVVTNWSAAKPMRGPSGPPAFWALESSVDALAHKLKVDPIALRRQWEDSDVRDALYDWAETIPEWRNRQAPNNGSGRFKSGIGLAIGNWFNAYHNATRIKLEATTDGLVASCAVQDMGQGSASVIARAIADELGISFHDVAVDIGDSGHVAGPISSASRTTASIYPVSVEAAEMLREELMEKCRTELGLRNPQWRDGGVDHGDGHVSLRDLLEQVSATSVTSNKRGGNGTYDLLGKMPSGDIGISVLFKMTGALALVAVDVDTRLGLIKPQKVWMGMSVGKIVNRELADSQVYGGVIQTLGFALTEERLYEPNSGQLLSFGLEEYRIPGIADIPEIETHYEEDGFEKMKGGACGLSELCTLPVAPALGNAVFNATGWRPTELPLRPHRVLPHVSA